MSILSIVISIVCADFAICTADTNQHVPAVLFANDQYYVFWQDERMFPTQEFMSLYCARVTKDGSVIDPDGKLIYSDSFALEFDVAYDGSNFLVAFRDPHC